MLMKLREHFLDWCLYQDPYQKLLGSILGQGPSSIQFFLCNKKQNTYWREDISSSAEVELIFTEPRDI